MKLTRVFWPSKCWLLLIIGLAIPYWLAPPRGATQEVRGAKTGEKKPEPPAKVPDREEVEKIQLQYVRARDLVGIIQQMVGGGRFRGPGRELRVSIDDRSNSVLAVGLPDDLALVKTLLSKLDVPMVRKGPTVSTQVFNLEYTKADPNLRQALRLALGESGFEVDPIRNVVIVSGDEKKQQEAGNLLQRLDRPQFSSARLAGEMQIRVVWLANGPLEKSEGKPPADLKEVIKELAKMGVDDPRLVTQTLITALPDRQFVLAGLAGHDSCYRLSISGTLLSKAGDTGRLQISVMATETKSNAPVGQVITEITAPYGHSVVLGMTPTANTTSVFVVQILPKK
jgi:hypothetical protein